MEAFDSCQRKLSREQQVRIMGMLAELNEKTDKENLRARISYRTCTQGISPQHIYEWSSGMIERLEEMRQMVR